MVSKLIVFATIVLESLPISSSAHIQLLQMATQFEPLAERFEFALHGPFAIMLAIFFFKPWLSFVFYNNVYSFWQLMGRFACIEIMTGILYGIFAYVGRPPIPLSLGFLISAGCLFSVPFITTSFQGFTFGVALFLGLAQGIALIPGISRFALTLAVSRWCGFSLQEAFQLSFLIEWPLLIAGSLKGGVSLWRHGQLSELLNLRMCLVMLIATIIAAVALKVVWVSIEKNYLWFFALYLVIMSLYLMFFGQ